MRVANITRELAGFRKRHTSVPGQKPTLDLVMNIDSVGLMSVSNLTAMDSAGP
jgi:hypothetical protein